MFLLCLQQVQVLSHFTGDLHLSHSEFWWFEIHISIILCPSFLLHITSSILPNSLLSSVTSLLPHAFWSLCPLIVMLSVNYAPYIFSFHLFFFAYILASCNFLPSVFFLFIPVQKLIFYLLSSSLSTCTLFLPSI